LIWLVDLLWTGWAWSGDSFVAATTTLTLDHIQHLLPYNNFSNNPVNNPTWFAFG